MRRRDQNPGRGSSPRGAWMSWARRSSRKVFCSHGFLLSLGASAELHLRQLDISNHIGVCWLSGSCLFQVVERFVIVPKVVEGHTGPVKGLEILPFFLQDFEAVLLDSLIVHQLSLEQAGCQAVVAVDLDGFHRLASGSW